MLKENITASLTNTVKTLEMFNWSITNTPVEHKFSVSISLNQEQIQHSVITQGQIMNAIINQYNVEFQNKILAELYIDVIEFGIIYSIKDNAISFSDWDIIKSIDDKLMENINTFDFIIVNNRMMTYLYDSVNFSNAISNNRLGGIVDIIGTWANIPIYMDPILKFNNNEIYLGNKHSVLEIQTVDSSYDMERVSIVGGYNIHLRDKLSSIADITNLEEYNDAKPVLREVALIKMGI